MAGVGNVPQFDQRGAPFGRVEDGNGNKSARVDMGAFELQPETVHPCDFDGMKGCDIEDIDALVMEIIAGTNNPQFDLTGDSLVNLGDRDQWLADAGALNLISGNPYLLGDANLDGTVDGQDFIIWNGNKFTSTGKWSQADWNADGTTDGQDFIIWNGNKFQSSDALAPAVLLRQPGDLTDTGDLRLMDQAPEQSVGHAQPIPSAAIRQIDAVFASSRQLEERTEERPQADVFDALFQASPINSYVL